MRAASVMSASIAARAALMLRFLERFQQRAVVILPAAKADLDARGSAARPAARAI
jgi:hypothetical protein